MKLLTALIVGLVISSPSPETLQEGDARLQGTWQSDRSRTLASVEQSSRVTSVRKNVLENSLGEMALIFERGKTAVKLEEVISDYYAYSILNYENDTIMLSIGPLLNRVKTAYTFEDDCFYMKDAVQDYKEYFCNPERQEQDIPVSVAH